MNAGPGFARVDRFLLAGADGLPRYRIQVGVPAEPPPAAGYPVAFLLDGDAAMQALEAGAQSVEARAGVAASPVLAVAIGYDLPADEALAARAFDYTPPVAGEPADPRVPAWRNGGADRFLNWIDLALRPEVRRRYAVDAARHTLCGHSYGGLCVLHALCSDPGGFERYLAASPSIWWRDGFLLGSAERLAASGRKITARVLLMVGDREAWHARPAGPDGTAASRRGGAPTLPAVRQVATVLERVPGLRVSFEAVAGGTHATLPALAARRALMLGGLD
ncbi:MAG: alpha/beta hydrolase-fold protein [Pigmentiphaga sp.]|nr:alpha/beta hydrolase-fold protein [Pigmentiphaga sp.]